MVVLHADGGGPLWASWSADPLALVFLLLAAVLYARGLASLGAHRHFHARLRPYAFYAGLGVIALALMSPLDALTDDAFWAHMSQHVLLVLVGVPLVLLGAPVLPLMRGIPRSVRRRLVIPALNARVIRRSLRLVASPLVAWMLMAGLLIAWHFPAAYDAAVRNAGVHTLQHVSFALGAYLFWWNVIEPIPLRANLVPLVRVPYVFLMMVPNFALSAFLSFASEPWFSVYSTGISARAALEDQQMGGLIMWIPGSFVLLAALLGVLAQALRNEESGQRAKEQADRLNAA